MRTNQIATVIVTAGLVVTGCVAAAQSASSATSARHASTDRLMLVDHTGPTQFTDIQPAGISVGDSFTFSESVSRGGRRAGFAGGMCTETDVSARSTSQLCTITAVLPHGQLVVSGIATYPTTGGVPPALRDYRRHQRVPHCSRAGHGDTLKEGSDRIVVEVITG